MPISPLPNFEKAEISERKLIGYVLNADHPTGSHKARRLRSVLGFEMDHADDVMSQIKNNLPFSEAVAGRLDEHGQRYSVDMTLTDPAGSATVRTGWIIDANSANPRLTTMFVKES